MGTVSAIPAHLFTYADRCTHGAEQFQNWVRSVLTPAMREYERNGGFPCSVLDSDVATQIAAAFYTDRNVRAVGAAFENVDTAGNRESASPPGPAKVPLRVDEQALNREWQRLAPTAGHEVQVNQGIALANRLRNAEPTEVPGIIKELARYGNDPYFSAGFYNSLGQRHIETAMALGGIPVLVKAYSTGALNKNVYGVVNTRLIMFPAAERPLGPGDHRTTAIQTKHFLDLLAASPAAASSFAASLDRGQLQALVTGSMARDPQYRDKISAILRQGMLAWPRGAFPSRPAIVSWELRYASDLPYPSVAPEGVSLVDKKPIAQDQLAVLSWIELHKDLIHREAHRFNVPPEAISAAIAWEALKNKDGAFPRVFSDHVPGVPLNRNAPVFGDLNRQSVGPGKVHINSEVVGQVESGGYLPRRGWRERQNLLRTDSGSITYIAAIMAGFSDTTEVMGRVPIRNDIPKLLNLYQGSNLVRWRKFLASDEGKKFLNDTPQVKSYPLGNEMDVWVRSKEGRRFLQHLPKNS